MYEQNVWICIQLCSIDCLFYTIIFYIGTGKTRTACSLIATLVSHDYIRILKYLYIFMHMHMLQVGLQDARVRQGGEIAQGIKNNRILACAHSNVATDNLLEGLIKLNVSVVRLGRPANIRTSLWNHTLDAKIQQLPQYQVYSLLLYLLFMGIHIILSHMYKHHYTPIFACTHTYSDIYIRHTHHYLLNMLIHKFTRTLPLHLLQDLQKKLLSTQASYESLKATYIPRLDTPPGSPPDLNATLRNQTHNTLLNKAQATLASIRNELRDREEEFASLILSQSDVVVSTCTGKRYCILL